MNAFGTHNHSDNATTCQYSSVVIESSIAVTALCPLNYILMTRTWCNAKAIARKVFGNKGVNINYFAEDNLKPVGGNIFEEEEKEDTIFDAFIAYRWESHSC